jgi:pimeloyl-ACP methyl ester carboxylesterase
MFVTTVVGGRERPVLPLGRTLDLPGRGSTFVRESPGPAGAPTVMLLHGWSATADLNWHPSFGPLSKHFHVIAMDHRGHGRGLRDERPFRLTDCADDVAAVAEQLGIDRMLVVGYSMGGPIAQLLWARHPHLVDGMVLCSTGASFASTPRLRALFTVAGGLASTGASAPVGSLAASALGAMSRWTSRRGDVGWGMDQVAMHDWQRLIEAGHEIGRYDARDWVGTITVPAAVLVTDDDLVVPPRHQMHLAESLPDVSVRHLPGGHHLCVTDPARFVPTLIDACREVASRRELALAS